jgi:hypothetical protein
MTDVLIRDVPDDVIVALDPHAGRLGLSRERIRALPPGSGRRHAGFRGQCGGSDRFASIFAALADPEVMSQAWT